jgi:hypothetical protein
MEASSQQTAHSLFVIYRQLLPETRQAFRQLLDFENADDASNTDLIPLSEPTLKAIWESPEEDYWDELYAKQHTTR